MSEEWLTSVEVADRLFMSDSVVKRAVLEFPLAIRRTKANGRKRFFRYLYSASDVDEIISMQKMGFGTATKVIRMRHVMRENELELRRA